MSSTRRSFNIGEIQCIAISDGTFQYPTNWMFSDAPRQQLEQHLREKNLPTDHILSPYTCLLVRTGKDTILIDTGADGLAPSTGNLMDNLKSESIKPEDITTVVLTHAHPDHIGGVLNSNGMPAFPNARYIMARTEWEFWTLNPDLHHTGLDEHVQHLLIGCAQKNLPPLKERIGLVDGEKEIAPGVLAIPAPGHTPGHMALAISSGKNQLLHIVDAVLQPLHLRYPAWRNIFDLNEDTAVATRKKLLDRAAADHSTILAYHFPFPGLGEVVRSGISWEWTPHS
jgi:glyoxylase-like metal-dependent hydrolase (beta-lactamase superfamily II)